MLRRLLLLFLLVNLVGVAINLPRIIDALDGSAIGRWASEWTVGVGTATGDLVEEIASEQPDAEEVLRLQQQLRDGQLEDPLDDESVAALVDLWHVLREAGEQVEADQLRQLLLDQGIDVTEQPAPSPEPTVSTTPTVP